MVMPRFIKLLAPSEIDSTKNVLLMKAYEENSGEASYITHDLQGYYLVSEEDLKNEKVEIPCEEELNAFASCAIETYRKREKAAEFVKALKDVLKAEVPNKTVAAEFKEIENPSVPNFYQFCADEAVKIQFQGTPIHSFFKPDYFLEFGTTAMRGETVIRNQIVDMPIAHFLGLAEPIPDDDAKRHSDQEQFKADVLAGKKTEWDIPWLEIRQTEDDIWKVFGHDGRHRAMLLQSLGYETMPVRITIPEPGRSFTEDNCPDELWCQNDKSQPRERLSYPCPITKENYNHSYIEIENITPSWREEPKTEGKAEDSVHGEQMVSLAPSSCVAAKRNYDKNRKAPLVIPFSTYQEFLKRKSAAMAADDKQDVMDAKVRPMFLSVFRQVQDLVKAAKDKSIHVEKILNRSNTFIRLYKGEKKRDEYGFWDFSDCEECKTPQSAYGLVEVQTFPNHEDLTPDAAKTAVGIAEQWIQTRKAN